MTISDTWVDFIAGWCSGGVAVVACQPVDTVLTRWQAVSSSTWTASTRTLTQAAGYSALWRGASPMIGAVPVQNALLMGGYGLGQRYAQQYAPEKKLAAIFVGGCTGGILQSFLMSPVELIKVSQQVEGKTALSAGREVVSGILHSSAWRGLGATLLRDGIPHGVWFVSYEMCKDRMQMDDPIIVPLVSGAVAATVAWGVGYPADLIKTRIQAGVSADQSIIGTARQLIREADGKIMHGLYRGFGMKLVRSIPASMIGFTVYEFVKSNIELRL